MLGEAAVAAGEVLMVAKALGGACNSAPPLKKEIQAILEVVQHSPSN